MKDGVKYQKAKRGEGVWITPEQLKEIKKALIDRDMQAKELAAKCGRARSVFSNALNARITASAPIVEVIRQELGIELS
jgi:ribosome-binding protein aMBF1 (putative translation factor)